jgi:SAM-dependent methyltransferase
MKQTLKNIYKNIFLQDPNDESRQQWIEKTLKALPNGITLLDAGAGEQRHKVHCGHLNYISQDVCEYEGTGDGKGLQTGIWDTSKIDIVSDILSIPLQNESVDVILCSEVLEHVPEPGKVIIEFQRLLKPGGKLIITAPFSSMVHFAPYHFCTGFSKYWYEFHLSKQGFNIIELIPNGDWFSYSKQEINRLGSMSRKYKDTLWPLAYLFSWVSNFYFIIRNKKSKASDFGCFGWQCIAEKI